jgi:hypothetical protein
MTNNEYYRIKHHTSTTQNPQISLIILDYSQ